MNIYCTYYKDGYLTVGLYLPVEMLTMFPGWFINLKAFYWALLAYILQLRRRRRTGGYEEMIQFPSSQWAKSKWNWNHLKVAAWVRSGTLPPLGSLSAFTSSRWLLGLILSYEMLGKCCSIVNTFRAQDHNIHLKEWPLLGKDTCCERCMIVFLAKQMLHYDVKYKLCIDPVENCSGKFQLSDKVGTWQRVFVDLWETRKRIFLFHYKIDRLCGFSANIEGEMLFGHACQISSTSATESFWVLDIYKLFRLAILVKTWIVALSTEQ